MRKQIIAAIMFVLMGVSGCAGDYSVRESGSPGRPYLVVYTSHKEEIYAPVVKEFEERFGVWVEVQTGGSLELLDRIATESGAPKCDVLFGGYSLSHQAYSDCFEPYRSAEAEQITAAYRIKNDLSTPFSLLSLVIVYHTKIVQPRDIPTGWQSLLDTKWKGNIAFADPSVSASSFVSLTALLQAVPGDRRQTLRSFADNLDGRMLHSSDEILTGVKEGLYPVGVVLEETALRRGTSGSDIAIVYPSEGSVVMPDVSSVIKGCAHPELAEAFIDFTVSRDIQQMIAEDFVRRPVRGDVNQPSWMKPVTDIVLLDYDTDWSLENQQELLAIWKDLVSWEEPR